MKNLILFAITAFLWCSCSHKTDPQQAINEATVDVDVEHIFKRYDDGVAARRAAQADKLFTEIQKKVGLNGVILYSEQGKTVYKKAFGWRNMVKRQDPLQVTDTFQLASLSKMFTAESIMLLQAQGKLEYDDEVRKHIPEFPYEGITIRHLLTHRSGLFRYESLADEKWGGWTRPIHNEELISLIAEHHPDPYNTPNTAFNYSNINYALLASVVERVTKEHFEDFVAENVFKPAGMHHTFVYSLRNDTILPTWTKGYVQGHHLNGRGPSRVQNDYLNGVIGDKMVYSTVDDLLRFGIALDNALLLPDSLQREAYRHGTEYSKTRTETYGFGWRMMQKYPDCVYHFGWWKGFRTFFMRDLALNRSLIILTNADKGTGAEPLWEFLEDKTYKMAPATVNPYYLRYLDQGL